MTLLNPPPPPDTSYDGYREWKQWNRLFDPQPHERDLFQREFRDIPIRGKRLLDIGFGSGALLGWASSEGAEIAGIELQSELRDAATGRGITTYENLDATPDSSFDIVTAFDVLEHIPREHLVNFLQQVRRIAAADARIVLRVPNCQCAAGLLNQFGDATHVTMLSGPIVQQLCFQAGLATLHVRESMEAIHPGSHLKSLLRPLQRVARHLAKIIFRLLWSSGSTPLSTNVTVIAIPNPSPASAQ